MTPKSPSLAAPGSPGGKSAPSPPLATHANSSDSTSTVRVSSPLNPARPHSGSPHTSPKQRALPLPSITTTPQAAGHARAQSQSAAAITALPVDIPLARVASSPVPTTLSSSLSTIASGFPTSSFRSRSVSTSRSRGPSPSRDDLALRMPIKDGTTSPASTWWNRKVHAPRPWQESAKKKKTIPAEQTEGYTHTRQVGYSSALSIIIIDTTWIKYSASLKLLLLSWVWQLRSHTKAFSSESICSAFRLSQDSRSQAPSC